MKNQTILYVFSLLILLSNCSKETVNTEPEVIVKIQVTDSILFNSAGDFTFKIEASDITATLTLVGAGGGGGGGVLRTQTGFTTGGGGGGGAGEFKLFDSISLDQNKTYNVQVGAGGAGGQPGNAGSDGVSSSIQFEQGSLFTSLAGKGGLSNSVNSKAPGGGGVGFPNGQSGGFGKDLGTFATSASAGPGGNGGFNQSGLGSGGKGGVGTAIEFASAVPPKSGNNGKDGFVKIVWTGLVDK